jgi:hypothetical protein
MRKDFCDHYGYEDFRLVGWIKYCRKFNHQDWLIEYQDKYIKWLEDELNHYEFEKQLEYDNWEDERDWED